MDLEFRIEDLTNGWVLLEPIGDIDIYSSPLLREKLIDLSVDSRFVVVSFRRVGFVDSTGLGVLLGAAKRAKQLDGNLQIICDREQLLKLLRLTGLDHALDVHPSLESFLGERLNGLSASQS